MLSLRDIRISAMLEECTENLIVFFTRYRVEKRSAIDEDMPLVVVLVCLAVVITVMSSKIVSRHIIRDIAPGLSTICTSFAALLST